MSITLLSARLPGMMYYTNDLLHKKLINGQNSYSNARFDRITEQPKLLEKILVVARMRHLSDRTVDTYRIFVRGGTLRV